jgi:hypothetical protein
MLTPLLIRRGLFAALLILGSFSTLEASKRIVVDLSRQIAIAYQNGQVKFFGRISSGKPGRETPTGSYHVREKDIDHVSNLWPQPNGGAKMHYMLRITRDGVAMHLGNTPDYPASHGCIRMQNGFAQRMYAWAEKWTKVDIIGKGPAHSPAVALPAYARTSKILRRSIGGGTRGPLSAMSSNPKDHASHSKLVLANIQKNALASKARKSRRTSRTSSRHLGPLDTFSTNPKVKSRAKKQRKRRSKKRKRRHHNPLQAISAH